MSVPLSDWDPSPHPFSRKRVCPPEPKEDEGVRGPNSDDWRKSLALCVYSVDVSFCWRWRVEILWCGEGGLCGVVVGLFDVLRWYWVCVVIEGGGVLYVVGGCCVA